MYTENGGQVAYIKNKQINKDGVQFELLKTKFAHDMFYILRMVRQHYSPERRNVLALEYHMVAL